MLAVGRSLGGLPTYPLGGPAAVINVVLDSMAAAGVVVVAAAGNSGGKAGAGL